MVFGTTKPDTKPMAYRVVLKECEIGHSAIQKCDGSCHPVSGYRRANQSAFGHNIVSRLSNSDALMIFAGYGAATPPEDFGPKLEANFDFFL